MFDLMYEHEGIGLAANQVNLPIASLSAIPPATPTKKMPSASSLTR